MPALCYHAIMPFRHHVAFAVPIRHDVGRLIVDHFEQLHYTRLEEGDGYWHFRRGSKSSVIWRMDIRAYYTDLIVRVNAQPDGKSWVSCDFDVFTFMTLIFPGDVATLEAEARGLESALRHALVWLEDAAPSKERPPE